MSKQDVLSRKLRLSLNPELINKNESGDDSHFKTGWINQKLTPKELADEINKGIAYTCELSGDRNARNFVCSDVLSVDIDGTRTMEDAKSDPFVERYLTIFYTTPNHTPQIHRFRLVFALPRSIETPQEMRAAYRSLALKLGGDRSATDPARIFFGSRGSKPEVFDRCITDDILDELIAHGMVADQRDKPLSGYTTTVSKQPIAHDRVIRLETGDTALFRELSAKTRIHCPFHLDRNASAFVTQSKTGTLGIHCSTCDQTFWPPNTTGADDFADFDNRVREAENYFSENRDLGPFQEFLSDDGKTYHPGLARSHIHFQQREYIQLPAPLPEGLVFIKSPKGTGKTEELRRLLIPKSQSEFLPTSDIDPNNEAEVTKNTGPLGRSTLLIGHRIALIRQSCARLGLDCYLDFVGPLNNNRLGVCVDSLHRLTWREKISSYQSVPKEKLFNTIIIDESEQVLTHFLSDTIEPDSKDQLFKIFRKLLEHAKTVIALDADLGWLSFETISKLAQPTTLEGKTKKSTIIVNERSFASPVYIYRNKSHLMGDLKQSLADGKRVFVTSNSMNLVEKLHNGLIADTGSVIRSILVTSETTGNADVKAFIADPAVRALDYDVILTSPSLGTGVDITFLEKRTLIDVVYGFFELNITTHYDFDQQIWRVRQPGVVKVWINPRRFSFETSREVVKRDIQQKHLFRSVLSDYDDDLTPQYHTDDPLIDMAVLARSQQLMSKNNLKQNYIAMKRRHGHPIEFLDRDDGLAGEGSALEAEGRYAADAKYRSRLFDAKTLNQDEFDDIEHRIQENEDVSATERVAFARTRMERFYRQPLSDDMIEHDDKGRFRSKIIRFEQLIRYDENELHDRKSGPKPSNEYTLRLRVLRDQRYVAGLLHDLLTTSEIFTNGKFDTNKVVSAITLTPFMQLARELKAVIENLLGIEVRKNVKAGAAQLSSVLDAIGLEHDNVGKTKAKSVAGGKTVYLYQLSAERLKFVEEIVRKRKSVGAWEFINRQYAFLSADANDR